MDANTLVDVTADTVLSRAIERLVAELDPQAIWLFGSRARGDHRPDSDYDLMVVAKENGNFGSDDYVKALRPTFGTGLDCEVVPCSLADFEEARALPTTLVSQVIQHGRLLYGARS
jgi:predicted nucleotidyltransferase